MDTTITVYGTWWCGDCKRVRRFLDQNNIVYTWVDIDKDAAGAEFVVATNHGMRSVPTLVFEDNSILVEPSEKELQYKLEAVLKSD